MKKVTTALPKSLEASSAPIGFPTKNASAVYRIWSWKDSAKQLPPRNPLYDHGIESYKCSISGWRRKWKDRLAPRTGLGFCHDYRLLRLRPRDVRWVVFYLGRLHGHGGITRGDPSQMTPAHFWIPQSLYRLTKDDRFSARASLCPFVLS